ncbi:MAG: DUF1343 domain-containing protein [Hyphomicrobiaceae bacterium]|nr:DUF1343 domain-containing protein [Hyphomicrobiaceae bacterium]
MQSPSARSPARPEPAVVTGAAALAAAAFAPLAGHRIGLITNQTGRVGDDHLADLLRATPGVRLTAIFAPEHGFRGTAEAGASVAHGVDRKTGVPVRSLYGATRKPTPTMLRDIDLLVFDIQDVGVRFYTYISTMGLAMQAAAARRIPFIVLDRANPLGGEDVSGFMLDTALKSFVGQYPMPIVHGMTVGEIARMIKGEQWLDGLEGLDLSIVEMKGWRRGMRWPETRLDWIPTSPNVPTFETALAYPGIGLVGETLVNEGRGTPHPFLRFGAPWLDARNAADALNAASLAGARFAPLRYKPRSIPHVAADPRFVGEEIPGVHIEIANASAYRPLEVGMHVLAYLRKASRAAGAPLFGKLTMFHATSGTKRLHAMIERGVSGSALVASWADEAERFRRRRERYLIY